MSVQNKIKALPATSIDSADIIITYKPINIGGFGHAPVLITLLNNSDVDVSISYDGTTDHEFIAKLERLVLNFQTNNLPTSGAAAMPKGTVVYARGPAAGTGRIILTAYYVPQG